VKLDVSEQTLAAFLSTPQEQLCVPLYQRPYSWTTEEVDQLWEDITTPIEAEHFMGSIVLNDEMPLRPQVIDGQQRLTTLMILLALIRDAYHEADSYLAGRPHALLTADPYTEGEDRYKLRLGEVNRDIFRDFFLRGPDEEGREDWAEWEHLPKDVLVPNADLFANATRLRDLLSQHLNALLGEDPLARLTALEEKLSKRLLFVVIRVGNVDDAFLLFETLNDRGLQLSAADLVKSHLLARVEAEKGKDAVPVAAQDWGEVVELLRGADIGRFLRYYLLMYEPKVQMDRVFKLFKKRLADETASSLLGHMKTMARYFGEFMLPSTIPEAPVRDVIEDINDLRAPTTYVVLLPAREALQGQTGSFVRLARLTEALAYRWTTIVGKNAQQLESIFQQAGSAFTTMGAEGLETAETTLRDAMPSRAEFIDAFRAKRMGTVYVARYTLRRIEEVLSPTNEWTLKSPAKVNLEHILPLNLSRPWSEALGGDAIEVHAESVDRWGNLTLLSERINKSAQDSPFSAKLRIYSGPPGSNIQMTQLLQREKSWGAKEIDARQRWLAEVADQVWSVQGAIDPRAISVPDYPFVDPDDAVSQIRLMISEDESHRVEFKETARLNTFTGKKDAEIEKAVGKTICAFANSYDGGTLLVGVDRSRAITGIEPDYQFTTDRDGFGLWLSGFVRDRIDPVLATRLAVSFVQIDAKTVCRVDVPAVAAPVFFAEDKTKRFYVRVQNQTNEYSGNDFLNYKNERWPQSI
jgi:hypothetical protein